MGKEEPETIKFKVQLLSNCLFFLEYAQRPFGLQAYGWSLLLGSLLYMLRAHKSEMEHKKYFINYK